MFEKNQFIEEKPTEQKQRKGFNFLKSAILEGVFYYPGSKWSRKHW